VSMDSEDFFAACADLSGNYAEAVERVNDI
jgi:hypothetical protein